MDSSEPSLAAPFEGENNAMTLFERTDASAAFLLDWKAASEQRHGLMRPQANLCHVGVKAIDPGDARIRMPVSQRARQRCPELLTRWQAMLIEVSMVGRLRSFINPLQDDQAHPAQQLAELHCQRLEIEVGFREIKPPQQEGKPLLRSKLPARVSQTSA